MRGELRRLPTRQRPKSHEEDLPHVGGRRSGSKTCEKAMKMKHAATNDAAEENAVG